jgi:hypothetical protein
VDNRTSAFLALLIFFVFTVLLLAIGSASDLFDHYEGLDFTSSNRGVNYEVTLVNREDPSKFCLINGRSDNVHIIALDYFYITQGDQIIHGVAIDNSRFEVHKELSGCWNIMREKDNFRVRLINLSGSDMFFKTEDSEKAATYMGHYEHISKLLNRSVGFLIFLWAGFLIFWFVLLILRSEFSPQ